MSHMLHISPLCRPKSHQIHLESCKVIPGGVNSPVRSFPGLEQVPLIAHSGQNDCILDADGFEYIDLCCSWGALIHGHAHQEIVEAAQKQVALGSSFGIATEAEGRLANKVCELMPSIQKVRFVSSGTEATMSAIRLARGATGRSKIVKFSGHYHGHADPFLVHAGSGVATLNSSSSAGVPLEFTQHTLCLPFNDCESLKQIFKSFGKEIAAVILEPIAANMGVVFPTRAFLDTLVQETKNADALLIFDEVITGFRVALGGAQELFGIEPDLTCLGKILGGGFPAAAFGGRKEIMDLLAPIGAVYQAGTLSGNPVAMEAGFRALQLLQRPSFHDDLEEKTNRITDPLREWIKQKQANVCLHQAGSLFTLFFGVREAFDFEGVKRCNLKMFKQCFQHLFERGIYLSPSQFEAHFVSDAHTEAHLDDVVGCLVEFLEAHRDELCT